MTQPGGTVPTPNALASAFDRGFAFTAGANGCDAVWVANVSLNAGAAVKINSEAITYATTGTATVTGNLAYTKDLAERAASLDARVVGVYNATTANAQDPGYNVYVGRYAGAVADWAGDPSTPASGAITRLYAGDGFVLSGYELDANDLIIQNHGAQTASVDVICLAIYQ